MSEPGALAILVARELERLAERRQAAAALRYLAASHAFFVRRQQWRELMSHVMATSTTRERDRLARNAAA